MASDGIILAGFRLAVKPFISCDLQTPIRPLPDRNPSYIWFKSYDLQTCRRTDNPAVPFHGDNRFTKCAFRVTLACRATPACLP